MPLAFLNDPETLKKVVSGVVIFFATTVVSFVVGRWWGKHRGGRSGRISSSSAASWSA